MTRLMSILSSAALGVSVAACSSGTDGGSTQPPAAQSISVQLSAASGTVARGSSGNTTVTVSRVGNYTGAVSLTAENLPTGVTAAFTPSPLTGTATSATLVFSVGAAAAAGASTITVRAAGSGVTAVTTSFALTIPTPAVALTAGSSATTIVVGGTATVPITITRSNGFTDAVTLAVTGLPTGVTPMITPATIAAGSTTSTLSLVVAGNAAPGASTVTISASGTGVTTQTVSLALTLTAAPTPAISLTSTPVAVSIVAGSNGITAIGISRLGGFTGDVTLEVLGLPLGVTRVFSANPVNAAGNSSTLTIATSGAAVAGIYNLTVRGTGTGISEATTTVAVTITAAPAITLSALPTAVTVTAGSAVTTAVTITRLGGYTADVALTATGLPAGVVPSFAPATLTGGTLTSTLTMTSTAGAALGAATVTVTASGTGVTTQTTPVSLTVTSAPTYTMAATPVMAQQGTNGTSTVTLTRGTGFTGTVNLAVTGLPANVAVSFNPVAVTGTTSTLTFAIFGPVTAGNYTGVITGTAAGLPNVTTNVSLTVTAPGGAPGIVNWTFCETVRFPLWFAFQNGTSGVWTRVTSTGTTTRVYSFTVNASGGVAYAIPRSGGGTDVTVQYLTQAEMIPTAANECEVNRATKSLSGTVAGVTAPGTAFIGIGGRAASAVFPITSYSVTGVDDGVTDLIGFRRSRNMITFMQDPPDRGVLRRNVNYAAGSAIPVIDFMSGESFVVASAQYTIANADAENFIITSSFSTMNGTAATFVLGEPFATGPGPHTVYGVPNARTQPGDLHHVFAFTSSGSTQQTTRGVIQYNRNLLDRTITLGPLVSAPTVTSLGASPYVRFSATGTWQNEYADAVGMNYTQQTVNSNSWTVTSTRSYAGSGASPWTLALPDFSGVVGFNTSWAMADASTKWSASGTGFIFGTPGATFTEGSAYRTGSRSNTISP